MTSSDPNTGEPAVGPLPEPNTSGQARKQLGAGMLLRGTGWSAIAQFVPLVINLVLTPYTIHGLGLEVYAVFLLVNSIQMVMSTFNGGIGPSVTRYMTIYAGRGDKEAATRMVVTMGVIVTAIVVVVFGIFFSLIPQFLTWFPVLNVDPGGAVFLLATQVVLAGVIQIRSVFQAVLAAAGRFAVTSIAILIGHTFYTVGIIITVEGGYGLTGIAWIFIAQQVMGTLIMVPASFRHLTRKGIGFMDKALVSEFFGFAWKIQLASWVDTLTQQIDTLIVGRVRPRELPYFGPGSQFAQQLRVVLMNAVGPITTFIGRGIGEQGAAESRDRVERLQRLWVRGVSGYFAVAIPAAYFGVTAWLHLGRDTPGQVAAILLFGHAAAMMARIILVWCQLNRRPGLDVAQGLVFLVLKVVGTVALVGPYGVVGVAVATSVSSIAAAAFLGFVQRRRLEIPLATPWKDIPWLLALSCGALSAVSTWGASHLIGPVVPFGVAGLLVCALAAAPALLIYVERAIGIRRLIGLVRSR